MFFTFLTKIFKEHHLSLIKSVFLFSFFVTLLQFVLWILHFLVYQTLTTFHPLNDPILIQFLSGFFFLISMSFVFFSIIGSYTYNSIIRFFYTLSAWWIGTLYWLFLGSLLLCIFFFFWPQFIGTGIMFLLVELMVIIAFGISFYGTVHSHSIAITPYTLPIKNLNPAWNGRKIALVADTHFGHVWSLKRASFLAQRIASLKPDMLLIPGDFYDGPPAPYEALASLFSKTHPPLGTFFVAGNHEQFRPSTPYTEALSKAGIQVLTNEKILVEGLQIIGVTYLDTVTAETTRKTLKKLDINPLLPSILLKHVPKDVSVLEEFNISLQVSGHTHFGQVWPFGYLTQLAHQGFAKGLKYSGKSAVITTTGAGTWGPPQRVGSSAEIVIITLTNDNSTH